MTDITLPTQLLIDGAFVTGEGEAERVLNPATGELLVNIPEASPDQIQKAVSAAHRAFEGWRDSTPMERCRLLLKLADAIEAKAEQFARLESLNCGKPYARALGDEIPAVADCFRYFAGAVRNLTGTVANEYLAGHTSMIRRDPLGVVASIAPWNYPLMMAAWKLGPAIAMGNTVILAASDPFPLAATDFYQVLETSDVPGGVVNIITGPHGDLAKALAGHMDVEAVWSFSAADISGLIEAESAGNLKRTWVNYGRARDWPRTDTAAFLAEATEMKTVWVPYGE